VRSGPEISHTIPDFCRVVLDRRLLPGEDSDTAFHDIENALKDVDSFTVEATRGAVMYQSDVAEGCAVALATGAAIRELSQKEAGFFYSPAALDAGFLNRHGIETIMFGPGDLRFAHTDQEAVALQEVRDAAKIYAATALQLLA